jgi:RHS repeat-associated protein
LVNVQNPNSDAVTYEYNESGIRVSSTINGIKTNFLIDANTGYAQVLEEHNSSGVQASYVYGNTLISQSRNGVKSFYLVDGLGSTKALTDSSGVVTDRYIYDAYGNLLSSSGSTQNSYLYTGQQFDSRVGQYYLRDRYYNPSVGRFTRMDSYLENSRIYIPSVNPISLNKYLYGNSNPVMFYDPKGLTSATIGESTAVLSIIEVLASIAFYQVGVGQISRIFGEYEWDGLLTGISIDDKILNKFQTLRSFSTSLAGMIIGIRNRETKQEAFLAVGLGSVGSGFTLTPYNTPEGDEFGI